MKDLISRQAVIDLLKQMRKDGDMVPWEGKDVFARIRKLPSAQLEQRWIPCSERLPSKADHTDDMVLVCYRNGSVRFNTYMNGWVQGNPVAWMPLPEPYREDES